MISWEIRQAPNGYKYRLVQKDDGIQDVNFEPV